MLERTYENISSVCISEVDDLDATYYNGVEEESLVAVQRYQRGALLN